MMFRDIANCHRWQLQRQECWRDPPLRKCRLKLGTWCWPSFAGGIAWNCRRCSDWWQLGNCTDATTMLTMMDVGNGDCILESGSGSGAMTLFLSRAVWSSGHVYSFEVRKDHHNRAKGNFQCWRNAYGMAQEKEWPNNVDFINKDIVFATDDIQGKIFDAVGLDMINPQVALPVISTHLKQGGVCAVYLTNITQVIDLLEGIRTYRMSLSCEKILEVIHRDWFVAPALRKDGSRAPRVEPQWNINALEHEEGEDSGKMKDDDEEDDTKSFCTVPYVARPHHRQVPHTAFLVKLRKLKPALQ
ncbi:tRNA (adenine(58)-N(1))-methyltransferase, mitochondrial isoform X2 [Mobula birostris]|uniref:tRNA (adenine(58)-N(1))-methyltransferase, mitochondrial isoform X2 n=1 Tax=Mobula birostris TaxID=1983395 RepID=UPI003B28A5E7